MNTTAQLDQESHGKLGTFAGVFTPSILTILGIIDVWWNNDASSRLMLLFAYLTTRSALWTKATIRLLAVGDSTDLSEKIALVEQQLDDARIAATPLLVVDMRPETVIGQSGAPIWSFCRFGSGSRC